MTIEEFEKAEFTKRRNFKYERNRKGRRNFISDCETLFQ